MERVAGRIILGPEDAAFVDMLVAWTARSKALRAAQSLQHNKNARPVSATDHAQSA